MAADGGCERDVVHRMNEGYRAWGALKSVLSNRGLGIKAISESIGRSCAYNTLTVRLQSQHIFFNSHNIVNVVRVKL